MLQSRVQPLFENLNRRQRVIKWGEGNAHAGLVAIDQNAYGGEQ